MDGTWNVPTTLTFVGCVNKGPTLEPSISTLDSHPPPTDCSIINRLISSAAYASRLLFASQAGIVRHLCVERSQTHGFCKYRPDAHVEDGLVQMGLLDPFVG